MNALAQEKQAPPTPVEIELMAVTSELVVTWEDGHRCVMPLSYLRGHCPCAACQGHGGTHRFIPGTPDSPEERTILTGIAEVGRYAVNLVWADDHKSGIYSFDILRELCPCAGAPTNP